MVKMVSDVTKTHVYIAALHQDCLRKRMWNSWAAEQNIFRVPTCQSHTVQEFLMRSSQKPWLEVKGWCDATTATAKVHILGKQTDKASSWAKFCGSNSGSNIATSQSCQGARVTSTIVTQIAAQDTVPKSTLKHSSVSMYLDVGVPWCRPRPATNSDVATLQHSQQQSLPPTFRAEEKLPGHSYPAAASCWPGKMFGIAAVQTAKTRRTKLWAATNVSTLPKPKVRRRMSKVSWSQSYQQPAISQKDVDQIYQNHFSPLSSKCPKDEILF